MRAFGTVCMERVELLEVRKTQSDKIIADQELRILAHDDEVKALERQKNILTPVGAALLGIAVGVFYQAQQD